MGYERRFRYYWSIIPQFQCRLRRARQHAEANRVIKLEYSATLIVLSRRIHPEW
jgi:hypothetical protein